MPMYDYRCTICNGTFEELVRNAAAEVKCPTCGSPRVERLLAKVAFSVNGKFTSSVKDSACSGCSQTSCQGCSSSS